MQLRDCVMEIGAGPIHFVEISRSVPLAAMQLRGFNVHGIPRTNVSSWEFHGSMAILASAGLHAEEGWARGE